MAALAGVSSHSSRLRRMFKSLAKSTAPKLSRRNREPHPAMSETAASPFAVSMIGTMSVLYLANHFPLLLHALSPLGRHLILVVPTVHPAAVVAVATLRRLGLLHTSDAADDLPRI